MKLLFLGGPLDGQLQETEERLSPLVPTTIKATLPNGIIGEYKVLFFTGNSLQFPLACFENLQPDDVFKMLLQWYSIKPRVRQIPTELPGPDSQSTDAEDDVIDVPFETATEDEVATKGETAEEEVKNVG